VENLEARSPVILGLEFSRYPQPVVFPDLKPLFPDTVPQPSRDEELILHLLIRKGPSPHRFSSFFVLRSLFLSSFFSLCSSFFALCLLVRL
jgi:hypothetical protein